MTLRVLARNSGQELTLFDQCIDIHDFSGTTPKETLKMHRKSRIPGLRQVGDIRDLDAPDYQRWLYGMR